MSTCKMFYEEDSDLMVKLRPYVTGDRINIPMANVLSRKWNKVVNIETGEARSANPLLDAFLNGNNGFALLLVADILHNLKLSVSFEVFKKETGFDPFDCKNNPWAVSEINNLRSEVGDEEVTALMDLLIWSLTDIHNNPNMRSSQRNYVGEVWEELGISPQELRCDGEQQPPHFEDVARKSRRRSPTPKKKIPLYKRVTSTERACDI